MRRIAVLVTGVLVSMSAASAAKAVEGGASLTLNLPALSYTSADTRQKPKGGSATNSTTSGFKTQDLAQSYAKIRYDRYGIYFYPFSDSKMVSVSYWLTDMIELGLDLGFNNTKINKPQKYEGTTNTIGVFGIVTPKLGTIDSEFILSYDSIAEKTDATTDSEGKAIRASHSQTNLVRLAANAIVPITTNLNYVGGLWYQIQDTDDKEGKVTSTSGRIGINLATLRMRLD